MHLGRTRRTDSAGPLIERRNAYKSMRDLAADLEPLPPTATDAKIAFFFTERFRQRPTLLISMTGSQSVLS